MIVLYNSDKHVPESVMIEMIKHFNYISKHVILFNVSITSSPC